MPLFGSKSRAAFALLLSAATARIHHLSIKNDPRFAFSIESFGFLAGGKIDLDIKDVSASPTDTAHQMGFLVYPTTTESRVNEQVDTLVLEHVCALGTERNDVVVVNLTDPSTWKDTKVSLEINRPGLWDLLFTHCDPQPSTVSFTLDATLYNPGPNYLSAGEMPLPWVYAGLCLTFAGMLVAWLVHIRRNKQDVHKIHHLMTLLLFTKMLSLLFESVMYHYLALTGHSTGWNVVFYIATFIRGMIFFAVIALVGAGWSLLKPFLNDREKRVLIMLLPMQLLSNIAIIVVDEMPPGSIAFDAWVDVLHVADLIASGAILAPVLWSIKQLRDAQAADSGDEKARNTLNRLTQFRSFYLSTIIWIYFTRIIVYLMGVTLSYDRQWLAPFFDELATVIYYWATGYRFRPAAENSSYLRLPQEDEDVPSAEVEMVTVVDGASSSGAAGGRIISGPTQTIARTAVQPYTDSDKPSSAPAAGADATAAPSDGATAPKKEKKIEIGDEADDFDVELDLTDDELQLASAIAAAPARSGLKHVNRPE